MRGAVLALCLLGCVPVQAAEPYVYVGAGYKFIEAQYYVGAEKLSFGSPWSAIFELGVKTDGGWRFGMKHDSQWFSGAPFNDDLEYHKTELFIGREFTL